MGYSTADVARIARLEAATRAAKRIVEQAKAEGHVLFGDCENDYPARAETVPRPLIAHQPLPYDALIRRQDLCG